jgi:aspartate aminotransferase/aminotransferase
MPPVAREAAKAAADAGRNGYTPTQGIPALRERLEAEARCETGQPDRQLCVTSGSSGALVLALMALIDPGDEVIVFEPAFVMYRPLVEFLGGRVVPIDTSPSFAIDVDAVAAAITPATRAILLNTPANPTGFVADADTVRDLARLAEARGVTLVSDELYRSYCYDAAFHSPALHSEQVVVIDGFSKSHAMTGWRVGWIHGPKAIIDAVTMMQQYTSSAPRSQASGPRSRRSTARWTCRWRNAAASETSSWKGFAATTSLSSPAAPSTSIPGHPAVQARRLRSGQRRRRS